MVSACETHSLVLSEDGCLFGMGDNAYGGLGQVGRLHRVQKLESKV